LTLLLLCSPAFAGAGLASGRADAGAASQEACAASQEACAASREARAASGASRAAEALRNRGIPPLLVTGLIAMVPVFELRGAIPVGAALFKIGILEVFAVSVLFNIVPVLPVLLFLKPVRRYLERKGAFRRVFLYLDKRVEKNRSLVEKYEELGLALFVAVPLPVTGAWTGALVAAVLGLRTMKSFLFVSLGVVGAGVIVTLFTALGPYGIAAASLLLAGSAAMYVFSLIRARRGKPGGR
jgi:uncharacterized membrane protein